VLKVFEKSWGVRSQRRRPPIVVEIDVENDEYNPTAWGRAAWQGVPLAFATIETVRKVLAAEGHRALFAWGLRFDPQITIGEGRPDYILIEFENEIAAALQHGDSFGPHPALVPPHRWPVGGGHDGCRVGRGVYRAFARYLSQWIRQNAGMDPFRRVLDGSGVL